MNNKGCFLLTLVALAILVVLGSREVNAVYCSCITLAEL